MNYSEMKALLEFTRKKGIWIISDEVYENLVFGLQFASPFDTSAGGKRTLVVSSISKSHMLPGFRSGWCVGPEDIINRILPVSEMMLFGAQPFLQDATAVALEGDFTECRTQRDALVDRAKAVVSELDKTPGIQLEEPEGGMFIMIDVGATGLDGEAFAWRLLDEEKVAVLPGDSFGEVAKNYIRLSLGYDKDLILKACRHIRNLSTRLVVKKAGTS
jgi:arginine:pyruvate transaminase